MPRETQCKDPENAEGDRSGPDPTSQRPRRPRDSTSAHGPEGCVLRPRGPPRDKDRTGAGSLGRSTHMVEENPGVMETAVGQECVTVTWPSTGTEARRAPELPHHTPMCHTHVTLGVLGGRQSRGCCFSGCEPGTTPEAGGQVCHGSRCVARGPVAGLFRLKRQLGAGSASGGICSDEETGPSLCF